MSVPDSIRGLFFDIHALVPQGASKDTIPQMLQALLAGRFILL
jgi:uncharacterized protein (TIGR03435 family)